MDIIEDGTGSSSKAKVTAMNQLVVQSESIPSEGFQAQQGKAFIIHAECHTSASASGAFLQIKNNDTAYDLEVTRIYIDPHTITPTDLICTQVFDVTESNGTDVSSTAIVQKDRNTAEGFDLTIKISDSSSDLTYTGGTQYHAFPVKDMSPLQRNMNSTNRLPSGKSITWGWKTRDGSNAIDGEIVSFSVNVIKRERT